MPMLTNRCKIYIITMLYKVRVISRSSGFGKQILARQNYIDVNTKTIIAKKSKGLAKYKRDI
jgi:hypothetical protein